MLPIARPHPEQNFALARLAGEHRLAHLGKVGVKVINLLCARSNSAHIIDKPLGDRQRRSDAAGDGAFDSYENSAKTISSI
jgi:hypothetical protein